jgi:hypothetical protein
VRYGCFWFFFLIENGCFGGVFYRKMGVFDRKKWFF